MSEPKIYQCGTLRMTIAGVVSTTALVMLGFFCMNFASAAVGAIPLRLRELGGGDATIAFLMSTIGGIFNMTVCPAVSFRSDRYRGKRFGRRAAFIFGAMPFHAAALILFGFSGQIGNWITGLVSPWYAAAPATVIIVLMGCIMVMYQFFYMFVASVIFYISNDAIPPEFQARVTGVFNVAAVGASALFNFVFFKYALSHFTWIMLMAGVVYAVGITVMCLLLKEPKFPPLDVKEEKETKGLTGIKTFVVESYSHPFYWMHYLNESFLCVAAAIGTFGVFFSQEMGLSLAEIGQINGYSGLCGMVCGMLAATFATVFVDRWHPMRVSTVCAIFGLLRPLLQLKWLFFTPDPRAIFYLTLLDGVVIYVIVYTASVAGMPLLMRLYPKSRFGQFCSASAMLRSVIVLVFSLVLGALIDVVRVRWNVGNFTYRYIWVWQTGWTILGIGCLVSRYLLWQKLGGFEHYKAPAPWLPEKFEQMPSIPCQQTVPCLVKYLLLGWDVLLLAYPAGALVQAYLARRGGDFECADAFLTTGLLPSLCALGAWIVVRIIITGDLRRAMRGEKVRFGIPHHGTLVICLAQTTLIYGAAIVQAVLIRGSIGARYWAMESLFALVAVMLVALFGWLEKQTPLQPSAPVKTP